MESSADSGALRIDHSDAKDCGDRGVHCISSIHQNIAAKRFEKLFQLIFIANIKFKIYRPIFEQGIPSELTAAVLNFPNREGDGGEKGLSELLLTSANLNITFI